MKSTPASKRQPDRKTGRNRDGKKVLIVTPAPRGSRKGNRVTALRWARMLQRLGRRTAIAESYTGQSCDLLLALHARRSAPSIDRFAQQRPGAPLVVAMTGTDLYRDLPGSAAARRSLQQADRLILLQGDGVKFLPAEVRHKARVIIQSAPAPAKKSKPLKTVFEVAVVGHLRDVKDPLRTAMAVRRLPADSRIRVVQIGAALSPAWEAKALREAERNERFCWLGELPRWQALMRMRRSRLLVVSSKMEGAPNVASESLAAGVPILCTKISGMVGLLGEDYPGYFTVGNTGELTDLLLRAESEPAFYRRLLSACRRLRRLVDPDRELRLWRKLLAELEC